MRDSGTIKVLTYLMFMMFALTTESVGLIIPEVMRSYHLGMMASGAFHYAPMTAIALSGLALGFLADRLGRKAAILLGLALFAADSFLFALLDGFGELLVLLSVTGIAIGIFKTGALALVGDITHSPREHTTTMNLVEGFFGIGSIVGPAIVALLLKDGFSWKWLYILAGILCCALLALAARVRYPAMTGEAPVEWSIGRTFSLLRDPMALGVSIACFLYVAVECSIYVWLPTYLGAAGLDLPLSPLWAVPSFFLLRAGGRFLGAWLLSLYSWSAVLLLAGLAIFVCFLTATLAGPVVASVTLPLSGLFMSVVYPTLNSKGISCFPRTDHGAVAGIILFFTCAGAGLAPLAMGAVSDKAGDPAYCFVLATFCAGILLTGFAVNWWRDPVARRMQALGGKELQGGGA